MTSFSYISFDVKHPVSYSFHEMSIRISIRFSYFIHNSELHACDKAAMRDDAVNGQTDQGYNEYVSTQYFHSRISET